MTIKKRIVVAVDKYIDREGNEKKKYLTIGYVHDGKYGEYITLEPTVDLAGVRLSQRLTGIGKPDDTRVTANLFDNNDRDQGGTKSQAKGNPVAHSSEARPPATGGEDFDDDLPF